MTEINSGRDGSSNYAEFIVSGSGTGSYIGTETLNIGRSSGAGTNTGVMNLGNFNGGKLIMTNGAADTLVGVASGGNVSGRGTLIGTNVQAAFGNNNTAGFSRLIAGGNSIDGNNVGASTGNISFVDSDVFFNGLWFVGGIP